MPSSCECCGMTNGCDDRNEVCDEFGFLPLGMKTANQTLADRVPVGPFVTYPSEKENK